jgi:uncharacterized protein YjiK
MLPFLLLLACTGSDTPTTATDTGATPPSTTTDTGTPPTDTDTGTPPTDTQETGATTDTLETGTTTDTLETGTTTDTQETGDTGPGDTLLAYYAAAGDPWDLTEVTSNLSGITWVPDTRTYLAVLDSNRRIHELAEDFTHLREIELEDIKHTDTEDIVYLGMHDGEVEVALISETSVVVIGTVPAGATSVNIDDWQELTFAPEPDSRNAGGEGLAFDPITETFWACSEKSPRIVWTFARPARGSDLTYEDGGLVVTEAFDAEGLLGGYASDISSCMYDHRSDRLLVLSHESGQVVDVGLDGTVYGTLPVELDLKGSDKPEALTMVDDADLVIGGEPNQLRVYEYSGP